LVTIFGSGLGPTTPVTATDSSTTSLGGVTVTFGSLPATLLYVSANQINLAVPLVPEGPALTTMQVTVNGVPSQPLAFPVVSANPTLFAVPGSYNTTVQEFEALAINADGSVNSAANPAQLGSAISVFVNGLAIDPLVSYDPPLFYTGGGWALLNYKPINTYVMQVNLQAPTSTRICPARGLCAPLRLELPISFPVRSRPSTSLSWNCSATCISRSRAAGAAWRPCAAISQFVRTLALCPTVRALQLARPCPTHPPRRFLPPQDSITHFAINLVNQE